MMPRTERYPGWLRQALYRLAIEANIVPAQGVYTRPAVRPAPFYTPYGVQFVWDLPYSAYIVATVGGDVDLARGFVENMLEVGEVGGPDSGMLMRSVPFEGEQAGQDGSQPPMLAWVSWQLHAMDPDQAFLACVYPGLAAFVDWWQSPRRDVDGDGLSEYAASTPTYAAYESGHDYSPERDLLMHEPTPPSDDGLVHEPIADVFLNSCLYTELDTLARIAEIVDPGRVDEWNTRRDALETRMREAMWDQDLGAYYPVVRRDLCPTQPRVHRHTPALLQPLWAGMATREEADRTVRRLLERPRDYPMTDGIMTVRLDPGLYHGYQVVTDALHPTAGPGPAAGGIERTPDGIVCRFGHDRGPAAAAFRSLSVEPVVTDATTNAWVEVIVTDGRGDQHVPIAGPPGKAGRVEAELGHRPFSGYGNGTWVAGLREIRVRARGCDLQELTVRYARMDRAGLLSRYGLKSAHPLDGKHPAPGAPTEFWSGTVWGPHNFHACQGLARYGHEDLARAIALAYCDGAVASYLSTGEAMEHHDPETGHGYNAWNYAWGAGVALVLMQEFLDTPP